MSALCRLKAYCIRCMTGGEDKLSGLSILHLHITKSRFSTIKYAIHIVYALKNLRQHAKHHLYLQLEGMPSRQRLHGSFRFHAIKAETRDPVIDILVPMHRSQMTLLLVRAATLVKLVPESAIV